MAAVVLIIAAVAGSDGKTEQGQRALDVTATDTPAGSSPDATPSEEAATSDDVLTPPDTPIQTDAPAESSSEGEGDPSDDFPMSDGEWTLESVDIKADERGRFAGAARITYNGDDAAGARNTFTISLFDGNDHAASLQGSADAVEPGETVTVLMISQDDHESGPFAYVFAADL